jgi:hypothetical protein
VTRFLSNRLHQLELLLRETRVSVASGDLETAPLSNLSDEAEQLAAYASRDISSRLDQSPESLLRAARNAEVWLKRLERMDWQESPHAGTLRYLLKQVEFRLHEAQDCRDQEDWGGMSLSLSSLDAVLREIDNYLD